MREITIFFKLKITLQHLNYTHYVHCPYERNSFIDSFIDPVQLPVSHCQRDPCSTAHLHVPCTGSRPRTQTDRYSLPPSSDPSLLPLLRGDNPPRRLSDAVVPHGAGRGAGRSYSSLGQGLKHSEERAAVRPTFAEARVSAMPPVDRVSTAVASPAEKKSPKGVGGPSPTEPDEPCSPRVEDQTVAHVCKGRLAKMFEGEVSECCH